MCQIKTIYIYMYTYIHIDRYKYNLLSLFNIASMYVISGLTTWYCKTK